MFRTTPVSTRSIRLSWRLALILVLAVPGLATATDPSACPTDVACTTGPVEITNGKSVCGLAQADGDAHAFLGMDYATSSRWTHSTLVDPANWPGEPYRATAFGPVCPQSGTVKSNACIGSCVVAQSEHCQSINVWKPADAKAGDDLPVMVWIYGGAFLFGDSATALFDGANIASTRDVVVVSFNYRLGALGFLANSDGEPDHFGNFGFVDQQNALRWVQKHVERFGGDPDNVTIFGESAGAMSVGLHVISAPASKGLFHAAVMQSNPISLPYKDRSLAGTLYGDLASELGCDQSTAAKQLACMKAVTPFSKILAAQGKVSDLSAGLADFMAWTPIIDGQIVAREPIEGIYDNQVNNVPTVPMIIGTNRNEGRIFATGIAAEIKQKKHANFNGYVYWRTLQQLFPNHPSVAKEISKSSVYGHVHWLYHVQQNIDHLSRLMTDYLFTCGNRFVAEHSTGAVYAYQFDQPPEPAFELSLWARNPECLTGGDVCHGAELPYVFGTFEDLWCEAPSQTTSSISSAMIDFWTHFATGQGTPKQHAPGQVGSVTWPVYDTEAKTKQYALFGHWTEGPVKLGEPMTVDGGGTVDCSFLNGLVPGAPWKSYQLFTPTLDLDLGEIDTHLDADFESELDG
ncbi:MAG: carboxylesterase family protein [Acidobacteriota bacterium]